ncbi:MAG: polysaccharide biosynthesis C-terminal domain-containing protein [Oscillospiraceae bacterium]|nr:polysaccharide biosynthesis C-terminal domain-containing protein [Oscillospiraceae bacterium]
MAKSREDELFRNKPVMRAIMELAFPTVIGQIILVVYNMADTFFVGLTNDAAKLTAVTVCMPAFMFLSAISNLFGVGGASLIARSMGSGDEKRIGLASAFALWGTVAVTLVYSAGAFILRDGFIDLLGGANPLVHGAAVEYVTVTVVLGGMATAVGTLFSHLIRSEGRAVYASVGIALGGVMNIALDPLFMFRILPPGRETLGAAIATALSNLVSLGYFIVVLFILRKKTRLSFRPGREMLRERVPAEVMYAGIPACVMTLFENISYAVLDKLISAYGVACQAGVGVAKKVNMLAHSIVRGITQGALPLIAYNYASGDHKRMKSSVRTAAAYAVGIASLCMGINLLFSSELISIFIHTEDDSLKFGVQFLRILCVGGPFSAYAYTIISFFQAVGDGRRAFLLATLRKGFLDIPLMLILDLIVPVYGIVAATPAADAVASITALIMFRRFLKRLDIRKRRKYDIIEG